LASIANIFIDAGANYSKTITVSSNSGGPLDLTGYTVKSQIRKSYTSTTAYNFTASVYDVVGGKIRLELTSTQTGAIPPGRYLYDVEITSPSDRKNRVVEGIVTVTPEITQI
jgi:hypothetical protein